ncbi:MAG: hypothetical protein HY360_02995 [Verrucomicrobia bacterium]|nr:hypothetical protein [Verrucomicrobiota bacterium]
MILFVHNPTEKPIACVIRPAKGFDLLGAFHKQMKVLPGQSVIVGVE